MAALTGDFAAYVAASFRQAVANGIWGWFDDDLALTRPWRFDLASIEVPVAIWQGGQDRMVPFAHGQWLATHLPSAQARLLPEEGHLLSLDRPGWNRPDGGPDPTCADAPEHHQPDGSFLTSNP